MRSFRPFAALESPPPADLVEKLDQFRRKFEVELPPSPPPSNVLPFVRPGAPAASTEKKQHVRIPTALLGKILDHGKASASAVHLLAIKCAPEWSGFVLSEGRVTGRDRVTKLKNYEISGRGFQEGIKVFKECGALERWQSGRRTYAKERLIGDGDGFILVDKEALKLPSKQLAFELAVSLSTNPVRPAEAAERIGITSVNTVRKLTRAAIAGGRIASNVTPRGMILLARRDFKFEVPNAGVKNVPTKNVPTKNVPAHRTREIGTEHERRAQSNLCTPPSFKTESDNNRRYDFIEKGEELKTNSSRACVNHIGKSESGDGQKVCAPAPLVFECGDVKITEEDWAKLIATYRHLDITSVMQTHAGWMSKQTSWRSAMFGLLNKKNNEMRLKEIEARARGEAAGEPEGEWRRNPNGGMLYQVGATQRSPIV